MTVSRRILLVSGAPGTGKTTLSTPLAAALGLPLFAKDPIKERIHDVLADAAPVTVEESRRLGGAAFELLWLLAANAPACVLEAAFWPKSEHQRDMLRRLGAGGLVVEVHLSCPREENLRRFQERGDSGQRHSVHIDAAFTPEYWENFDGTLGVGPVLEVDTSAAVDVAALVERVRETFAGRGFPLG